MGHRLFAAGCFERFSVRRADLSNLIYLRDSHVNVFNSWRLLIAGRCHFAHRLCELSGCGYRLFEERPSLRRLPPQVVLSRLRGLFDTNSIVLR